jgi:hypothetical protein
MDMRSLQAFLKANERVCTLEKAHAQSGKKASHENKTGNKRPSTGVTKQVSKKVCFEKSCEECKKHGGAHTTHATKDCCRYKKDGMVKADFCTTKIAGKMSKKLDTKLEKTLKKASLKSKKHHRDDSDSDRE